MKYFLIVVAVLLFLAWLAVKVIGLALGFLWWFIGWTPWIALALIVWAIVLHRSKKKKVA